MIIWLILALCLTVMSVAAVFSKRSSTKVGALAGLAMALAASWLLVVLVLGDLSAHYDSSSWPSGWFLALLAFAYFAVVAAVTFLRKQI